MQHFAEGSHLVFGNFWRSKVNDFHLVGHFGVLLELLLEVETVGKLYRGGHFVHSLRGLEKGSKGRKGGFGGKKGGGGRVGKQQHCVSRK